MSKITDLAKKLLNDNTINLFIGYNEGLNNTIKPAFISTADTADKLVYNEKCLQNLVAYLHKPEIKAFGKIAIITTFPALRAFAQLKAENQFRNLIIIPIVIHSDGSPELFLDDNSINEYIKVNYKKQNQHELDKIAELMNKDINSRWDFWVDELSDCIKCYACRSACPMCYCDKCTTDCNQPQWVPTSTHALGNMEWHLMRAMHLAGRCVNCNECFRVCPMDIPLNLLTRKLNEDIEVQFGQTSGLNCELNYALSNFKFEDKENFIR